MTSKRSEAGLLKDIREDVVLEARFGRVSTMSKIGEARCCENNENTFVFARRKYINTESLGKGEGGRKEKSD